MNRTERAKQFLPFDALKGLHAELRRREEKRTRVERAVLDESQQAEISEALVRIANGGRAEITRYESGHYVTTVFDVKRVDAAERVIKLADGKIYFDDLFSVVVID